MAKHAKKPRKKREQPWLAAARERLKRKPQEREDFIIAKAFLELVGPGLADASDEEIPAVVEMGKMAWNLPMLHALSVEPGSEGAAVRDEVEAWLACAPEDRVAIAPLAQARVELYSDLCRPILQVFGEPSTLGVRIGHEEVPDSALLPIGDDGWPSASGSLLALSEPARAPLAGDEDEASLGVALEMTMLAWNLHTIELPGADVPSALRERLHELKRFLDASAPALRATSDAMIAARRTRFGYDPRLFQIKSLDVEDDEIRLEVAAVDVTRRA